MHGWRRGQGEGARRNRALRKREDAGEGGQGWPLTGTGGRPCTAAGGDKERGRDAIALYGTEGEDGWGMGDDGDEERGRPGWLPPFLLWGVDGFLVGRDLDLVGLDGGLGTAVEVIAELD